MIIVLKIPKGNVTEISAADKAEELRRWVFFFWFFLLMFYKMMFGCFPRLIDMLIQFNFMSAFMLERLCLRSAF